GRMEDLRQNSRAAVNPAGPAPMMTAVCCDTVMYPFRRAAIIYRKISSRICCPRCVHASKIEILLGPIAKAHAARWRASAFSPAFRPIVRYERQRAGNFDSRSSREVALPRFPPKVDGGASKAQTLHNQLVSAESAT